jgi:hypothetical protein
MTDPVEALARLETYRDHRATLRPDVIAALAAASQKEVAQRSGLSRQWVARIAAEHALNHPGQTSND